MENENEDQILARALEESLRHYNEVELPRLTQAESKPKDTHHEEVQDEIEGVDDWDYWEDWDDAQIETVVQAEEAVKGDEELANAQTFLHNSPNKNKCSSKLIDDYIHREVVPKKCNVSIGEVGNDGADGFDEEAGRMWIYPCNFPIRKYQLDIVHSALFDNTLVSLPTGLGKTFIAAVVMYNFYRWFPLGKIIFLAPTRPLVAQQIHACCNIMGIPQEDTIELTGSKSGIERGKAWKEKRVFFATPQVFANDLGTGVCPGELVRCVVVDEAHRAAGNHAICQSFRSLSRLRERYPMSRFRVVALSATPGKNANAVSNVVSALQISKLELRDEQSPDVEPYTHRRNLETVVVPLGPELSETRNNLFLVIDCYFDRLVRRNLLHSSQKSKLNKFQILLARDHFRKNAPPRMNYSEKGIVEGDFATCITLVHALGLLLTHGQRTFMSFMQAVLNGDKGSAVVKARLCNNTTLSSLLSHLQDKLGTAMPQPAPDVSLSEGMASAIKGENGNNFIASHPKMNHLRDIVVKHFESYQASGESTRVMIFCEYRDPVVEICNMLMQHWPLVKPMSFVGQSSSSAHSEQGMPGPSKGTKGFTQKQQLQVIRGFREGGYNVLVSTCVGEEGLDIGEVDLIVCYDAPHASPLRLVQRMGRTGRKREGRVVTLVTKDVEEQKHRQGLRQKSTIVKSLLSSKVLETSLYRTNARVLPPGSNPTCHMMPMTIPKITEDQGKKNKKGKTKAEKNMSIEDMLKKGKRKSSARSIEINLDDEKFDGGFEGEMEGEEDCAIVGRKTSLGSVKHKGRGKTSKNVSKMKPKKSIKEFFNKQKVKVLEPVVISDGDAEDDDFVGTTGDNKTKTKCYEDCDEVIMDEDIPTALHSASPIVMDEFSTNKEDCQVFVPNMHEMNANDAVFSEAITLPPSLQGIEDSLPVLFGNLCCNDLKMDSPYRCSVIMAHFQLRKSTHHSPNIFSVLSLDSITDATLSNFDVEEEASKVGTWKQDPTISPSKIDNKLLVKNYEVSCEKYNHVERNSIIHTSMTSLWSSSSAKKKENLSNKQHKKSTDPGVKTINNFNDDDVIEILDSDEEKSNCVMPNRKKATLVTTPTHRSEMVKDGLLWNVLGKKEANDKYIGTLKSIHNKSESEILRKSDLTLNRASMSNQASSHDNGCLEGINRSIGNTSKTDKLLALIPISCDNIIVTSPDIIGDGFCGSHESTPEKGPANVSPTSKDHSCGNTDLQKQSALASSTPKVHRRNLFSPQACLPSPIGRSSKKPIDACDLLSVDVNVLNDKHFPHCSNTLTSPRQSSFHLKNIKEQEEKGIKDDFELPNFDLGSPYWFSSSSSDVTIFEPEINDDRKEAGSFRNGIRSSQKEGDGDQLAPFGNILGTKHLLLEQVQEQLKVEKSDDLFENNVEEVSKNMNNKSSINFGNTFGGIYDHSFTVTQAVNMLVPSENLGKDNKEESCSERREVDLKKQYRKYQPELSSPNEVGQLQLINKSFKDEGKESAYNEKVSSFLEIKKGNLAASEVINKDGDDEINFDIGDDILLDVSADLFAEDDTKCEEKEDNGEVSQIKSLQIASCRMPETDKSSHGEVTSHMKWAKNGSQNKVAKVPDNGVSIKSKVVSGNGKGDSVHKSLRKFQEISVNEEVNLACKVQENASCISGWNTDGWLSKGAHCSKSKLSLGLSVIKRQAESKVSSETEIHLNKSKVSKVEIREVDKEITLKSQSFAKSKRGDSWIDEITAERPVLECIDTIGLKPNECPQSFDAAPSKKEESLASDHSMSSFEFEDHDFFEKVVDCQAKSYCDKQPSNEKKEVESADSGHDTSWQERKEMSFSRKRDIQTDQREELSRESTKLDADFSDGYDHLENIHRSASEQSESSDDFKDKRIAAAKRKTKGINSKNISISSEENLPIRVRRGRIKKCGGFLDTQAEESFVEIGGAKKLPSDEEEDDGRGQSQYYDPSFINDGVHNSQETEVDMHAKYLQSVKSPRNAKYKIPNLSLLKPGNDSFQVEERAYQHGSSDSSYMNDSFCVDLESSGGEKEVSVDELDVLEAILANDTKNRKRRKEKSGTSSDEQLETLEIKHHKKEEDKREKGHRKKHKRKRIVVHDSSEDEQDQPQISPNKRSFRSEAVIPIIDKKLFEALSQDFEEDPPEPDQVGAKCFISVKEVDRSLVCDNVQTIEKGNKSSSDSKLFTERTCKSSEMNLVRNALALGGKNRKSFSSCDSILGLKETKENSESGENSTLKSDEKKYLGPNDKLSINWSSDLFNFSDNDDEYFSVIKTPPNISKSSSADRVLPAFPLVPMNTASYPEKIKPNASSCQCFENMSSSQSAVRGHVRTCNCLNEKPLAARKEMPVPSRPVICPSSSSCDTRLVSVVGPNKKSVGVKEALVVVSPVEACRSSEVMSALRAIRGVRMVVYAASGSTSIPYSLGRNLCLLRVSASVLGRNPKASDAIQTAFGLFHKVSVIVEWEKECDGAQNSWSKRNSSAWNSVPANYSTSAYTALLNFRDAGVDVLHSSGQVETANLIAEIAKHQQDEELKLNMQPVVPPASFESSNPVLKFYSSLPGLNIFQVLGLWQQFPKINSFLERCTSARLIQIAANLDLNKALHLHKILANVHISDT